MKDEPIDLKPDMLTEYDMTSARPATTFASIADVRAEAHVIDEAAVEQS